ncbi:MAG: DUF1573 domain-containing protein [Planctomycetaceae bacterium]|jgi:hypothetical protein|nr:DUF1573 domain-containing protein [Planctomycetaceae bacterium]
MKHHYSTLKYYSVVLLIFCSSFCGCANSDIKNGNEVYVIANPSVLDIGEVRVNQNPVRLSFVLENHSPKPVHIRDIMSSCGCAVVKKPDNPIKPHGNLIVFATININGQNDCFAHQICVQVEGQDMPILIEIKGHVLNDFRYLSPVRLAIEQRTGIAKGTFEIFTNQHPNIQFCLDTFPKGIALHEISRSKSVNETSIRFGIEIAVSEKSLPSIYHLVLQPTDPRIVPLNIEIQCFTAQ